MQEPSRYVDRAEHVQLCQQPYETTPVQRLVARHGTSAPRVSGIVVFASPCAHAVFTNGRYLVAAPNCDTSGALFLDCEFARNTRTQCLRPHRQTWSSRTRQHYETCYDATQTNSPRMCALQSTGRSTDIGRLVAHTSCDRVCVCSIQALRALVHASSVATGGSNVVLTLPSFVIRCVRWRGWVVSRWRIHCRPSCHFAPHAKSRPHECTVRRDMGVLQAAFPGTPWAFLYQDPVALAAVWLHDVRERP